MPLNPDATFTDIYAYGPNYSVDGDLGYLTPDVIAAFGLVSTNIPSYAVDGNQVLEAPVSQNGNVDLAQNATWSPFVANPSVNALSIGDSPLLFVPSVTDAHGGNILIPLPSDPSIPSAGSPNFFMVPIVNGVLQQGFSADVLPDMSLGTFVIENNAAAAEQNPGFDVSGTMLAAMAGGLFGVVATRFAGGAAGAVVTAAATEVLQNLGLQGTVHIPYVAPQYNPDTIYGFGPIQ